MTKYTGACLCGGVSFEYEPTSLWCAHCHCSLCQRAQGAPVVTWVCVPQEQFTLQAGESLR